MIRLPILLVLVASMWGCPRKSDTQRAPEFFLFSKKADKAAGLPWQDWSPAILEASRTSGKPIFMSLTRSLCSPCTLLDESTLSNERVLELLREKFILVRVNTDIHPEMANRFGPEGSPRMVLLNAKAEILWDGPLMQPTHLNQKLNAALRNELPVKLSPRQRRYDPNPERLPAVTPLPAHYPTAFMNHARFEFDQEFKGYPGPGKSLALADLEFDLKLAYVEWNLAENRNRVDAHLDSVFTHLYDPHDGGFLTGAHDAGWKDFIPVKRADEQAAMAAVLSYYSYWAASGIPFARTQTETAEAASATVAYLEQRLIDDGHVFAGEMGSRDYYLAERRGSFAGTQTNSVLQTSVTARLADRLAEAGYWAGKQEWIDKAAQITRTELALRLPNGLFWHVKNVTGDRLEDATAMLGATLSLYTATGEEHWLTEAGAIAMAMEPLFAPEGYYLDVTAGTTGGTLQGEPMPMLNAAAAASLLKLSVITNTPAWADRAGVVAGQFAVFPRIFLQDEAYFAGLVWQLTQPLFRLEVPRAWRTQAAAKRLIHPAHTLLVLRWIDGNQGRICHANKCSLYFGEPEKLAAAAVQTLSSVQSPGKADLKNPFFK